MKSDGRNKKEERYGMDFLPDSRACNDDDRELYYLQLMLQAAIISLQNHLSYYQFMHLYLSLLGALP
jgi:hypothetical protein